MKKLLLLFVLSLAFANCSTNDEMDKYKQDYTKEKEVFEEPPVSVNEVVPEYDEPVQKKEEEGWSEEFKSMFMSSCTGGIKSSDFPISDSDIRKICECEIQKIRKVYPNPNEPFDAQILMKLEEKCGREVLGL